MIGKHIKRILYYIYVNFINFRAAVLVLQRSLLHQKLKGKEQTKIADKRVSIADKTSIIADKRASIADKTSIIADKRASIADKTSIIADKRASIADKASNKSTREIKVTSRI
ncbi:hypothetical protein [Lysinibacillus sp. Ag94]|uniref:hypothetical protein n=1 Tax=Lysinibacillus sp. Ag94 TaxID=2936682 RepID=UPI00200FCE6A|nr:hypothetical protein [Lysinibacillus sp. Ag94]UPW81553.1 hypothetical protein MY533_12390 [Lysinibacillus sp. Ag94]